MKLAKARFKALAICSALCSLGLGTALRAQQPQSAEPPSDSSDAAPGLNEVVVTAQRREQRLADVPVSVSVVSGEKLQQTNIKSLQDLAARLPNVIVAPAVLVDLINIRGVGSGSNPGFEQSVGTFEDGVYRQRSRSIRAALFDVEQVEVLKGPQTTFFGANAIAGALNISTRKPGDAFAWNVSALAGTEGEYGAEGGVTVPVSDTLSFRVAARASGSAGYEDVGLFETGPDNHTTQGRVAVRWEPNEEFRSDFRLDASSSRTQNAFPFELVGCPPPAPFTTPAASTCALFLATRPGAPVDNTLDWHSDSPSSFANYDFYEAAWTNSFKIGHGSLNSITSFFDHDYGGRVQFVPMPIASPVAAGLDGFPAHSRETYNQFAQELRYQSDTGGRFEYMFGGYFSKASLDYQNLFGWAYRAFGANPAAAAFGTTASTQLAGLLKLNQDDRTSSAFASATIRPIDGFRINLGARFTSVHKSVGRLNQYGTTSNNDDPSTYAPFAAPQLQAIFATILAGNTITLGAFDPPRRTDDKFMPSAGIQIDLRPDVMAYATWSTGFKAGGYSFTGVPAVFEPETVRAYEVGVKGTYFERRLVVNADVFLSDYKNLQESTVVFLPAGPLSLVQNAAQSRSQGVELNTALRITDYVSISSDLAYLDASYKNYSNGACTILGNATGCVSQNLTGKPRGYSPKWSGNIGLDIAIPAGEREFRVSPLVYANSRFFESATADPLLEQGAFAKVDLNVAYGPSNHQWEIALIGKNLTDRLTANFRQNITGTTGALQAIPDPPRTVALQFSMKN